VGAVSRSLAVATCHYDRGEPHGAGHQGRRTFRRARCFRALYDNATMGLPYYHICEGQQCGPAIAPPQQSKAPGVAPLRAGRARCPPGSIRSSWNACTADRRPWALGGNLPDARRRADDNDLKRDQPVASSGSAGPSHASRGGFATGLNPVRLSLGDRRRDTTAR